MYTSRNIWVNGGNGVTKGKQAIVVHLIHLHVKPKCFIELEAEQQLEHTQAYHWTVVNILQLPMRCVEYTIVSTTKLTILAQPVGING